jgi:leucyl-tRNA synthetase
MALTNAIIEAEKYEANDPKHPDLRMPLDRTLVKQALHALVQMMAPITPAFSEECWRLLHPKGRRYEWTMKARGLFDRFLSVFFPSGVSTGPTGHLSSVVPVYTFGYKLKESTIRSVFDFPFPEPDGTLEMLGSSTQKCAVQINGKMKFVVEIGIPPLEMKEKELEQWLMREISKTEEGKTKLKGKSDVSKAKKVIIVRGGKTINFVL